MSSLEPDPDRPPTDRPSRVEQLFLGAVGPDGSCEPEKLEILCGEWPALAGELRELARCHALGRAWVGELAPAARRDEERVSLRFRARYDVLGEIARGGMGVVLEVWDSELRRKLAMKRLRDDRDALDPLFTPLRERRRKRLLDEAQVLAQLEHPGIVPVYDVGVDEQGEPYFTMLRVRGARLDRVFAAVRDRRDGWTLTRALGVLLRVSEAVAYAHQKGVLHRDLKPANVMVGSFGEAYVMDWGLARASAGERIAPGDSGDSLVRTNRSDERESDGSSPFLTQDGEVVGTPAYMAPEQARGRIDEIDARSDVYSLGAMLYELLAGSAPFALELRDSPPQAVLAASLERAPMRVDRLARDAPAELTAICSKAMARERERRYATVAELADDLRAYLEGRVVRAHRTGALVELRKWMTRNKGAAAAVAALILGLGATATVQSVLKHEVERARSETSARNAELRQQNYFNSISFAVAAWKEGQAGRMRALLDACPSDLRGWEWRFLDVRVDTSERVIHLPPDRNRHVGFTPDGCWLLTGAASKGAPIALVDPDALRPMRVLDDSGSFNCSFSADGTRALVLSGQSRLLSWDTRTWDRLPDLIVGVPEEWPSVRCSPTEPRFAVDGPVPAEIRELDSGALLAPLDAGQGRAAVAWSHDGTRVYTAGQDGSLAIWDAHSLELLRLVQLDRAGVSVEESPDGRWLSGWGPNLGFVVWDRPSMGLVQRIESTPGHSAAWSPDSSLLAVATRSTIDLFEAEDWGSRTRLNGHRAEISSLGFDATGERLVSASFDGEVRVWDVGGIGRLPSASAMRGKAQTPRFSRDGKWLAVPWTTENRIEIWSLPERRLAHVLHPAQRVSLVDLAPDGDRLLCAAGGPSVAILDVLTARTVGTIEGTSSDHAAFNDSFLRFSPDGKRISLVGFDGSLSVWDADSLQCAWTVQAYSGPYVWPSRVGGGCWSSDGRLLATLPQDGRVQIWDAEHGTLVREWEARSPANQRALFSLDGRRVFLSSSTGKGLECWDLDAGECVWDFGKESASVLALDPNGERLFCVNVAIAVRDAATGALILTLELDDHLDYGFAVSPAADVLVTASSRGLRFWDTRPPR